LLECSQCFTLGFEWYYYSELDTIIYEGDSIVISRVSAHRKRAMKIRVNKLQGMRSTML
jgi:hypothetical protein